ncbi:putative flavin-dependent reductase [Streptomyces hygroscopicus subsp. jinggangensis 5008]|nr:putative flavin-dependent reductase [Streptomyces hygroscopicus subsp. jinggangensis 5008]AGF59810.1 putative flavin-dependent reductase [Streptomyces hygroscopicus subsp. jinggangensis TL01]
MITTTSTRPDSTFHDSVWSAAGRVATGVSVLTAGRGDEVHGSTASTFTFISRQPPLIAVALHRDSHLLTVIRQTGTLGVNVLSSRQTAVARHFASRKRGRGIQQFTGIPWQPDEDGVPRLAGTVSWLCCRAEQYIAAGDHEIVLAEVRSVSQEQTATAPLLYFAGRLHPGSIPTEESEH